MSELAALDTDQISFIAYWNVESDGGMDLSQFDPTETIDAMETHEVFDNGVDGTVGLPFKRASTRFTNCRVKEDGWFIVWLDRSKFADREDKHGVHDVLNDWSDGSRAVHPHENSLAKGIVRLFTALPDKDFSDINVENVSLYNYEQPDADVLTIASIDSTGGTTLEIQPIDGITIEKAYAVGSAKPWRGDNTLWINYAGEEYELHHTPRDVTDGLEIEEISKITVEDDCTGSAMIFWS